VPIAGVGGMTYDTAAAHSRYRFEKVVNPTPKKLATRPEHQALR